MGAPRNQSQQGSAPDAWRGGVAGASIAGESASRGGCAERQRQSQQGCAPDAWRGGVAGTSIAGDSASASAAGEGERRWRPACQPRRRLAALMRAQCTAAWYAPAPFSFTSWPARRGGRGVRRGMRWGHCRV